MRPLAVVVIDVDAQHVFEVTPVEDQKPVQAFGTRGSDEALGDRVRLRCTHRRLHDPDALGAEDLIEGAAVLAVAVADQEADSMSETSRPRLRACCACGVKKFDSGRDGVLVIPVEPVQTARRADLCAVSAPCWVVGVLARAGGERELEIVVLRHQLAILRRGGKRPRYTTADRALLAAASRLLPPERWSCFAVGPQTLRRWHRALLARRRRRCRRRPGRPPLAAEPRSLITRLARENPRWGDMRIQGELLKLGIGVSHTSIATLLRSSGLGPAPRRTGPTWSEFLRAQAHSMLGGGLRDSLDSDTFEPSGWAADREARQVEADDNPTPADVAGPQPVSQPLPVSSRQALPRQCVLPATRGPSHLQPSHRSHARDGPRASRAACPTTKCSGANVRSHRRSRPASAPTTGRRPQQPPRILAPTASARPIDDRSALPR